MSNLTDKKLFTKLYLIPQGFCTWSDRAKMGWVVIGMENSGKYFSQVVEYRIHLKEDFVAVDYLK